MQRIKLLIYIFLGILFVSGCSNNYHFSSMDEMQKSTIFFRVFQSSKTVEYPYGYYKSYMVTMPERTIQFMGYSNGNAGQVISNDEELIAATCFNDEKSICILKTSSLIDKLEVVPDSNLVGYGDLTTNATNIIKKISLPNECTSLEDSKASHQMSWSYDNKEISIICGTKLKKTILCIVGVDGNSKCYPESTEKKIIYAAWSPKDDTLAVSSTTYTQTSPTTYLFDPKTVKFQQIFSGFSPSWSPTGDQIASYFIINSNSDYYGLQLYSLKEKQIKVLLPNEQSKAKKFSVWPTVDEYDDECSISWSLDEKQLVFSSHMINFNFTSLLLYDFKTGNIQFLNDPDLFQYAQMGPQWSVYKMDGDSSN